MRFDDIFELWGPDDIRLKGHRIALDDLLDLLAAGRTAEEIAAYYPSLAPGHAEAALAYYAQHEAELAPSIERQREYREEQTRLADVHPSVNALRMRALLAERRHGASRQSGTR